MISLLPELYLLLFLSQSEHIFHLIYCIRLKTCVVCIMKYAGIMYLCKYNQITQYKVLKSMSEQIQVIIEVIRIQT